MVLTHWLIAQLRRNKYFKWSRKSTGRTFHYPLNMRDEDSTYLLEALRDHKSVQIRVTWLLIFPLRKDDTLRDINRLYYRKWHKPFLLLNRLYSGAYFLGVSTCLEKLKLSREERIYLYLLSSKLGYFERKYMQRVYLQIWNEFIAQ